MAYAARIQEIRPQLSPELIELATNKINLHDGLIRRIALDRPARSLSINLRCGDLHVGYFDVDLVYADVDLDRVDPDLLNAIAADPTTELLYHEIDLKLPGLLVHRMIFSPKPMREIQIVFRCVKVWTEPRPDRELGRAKGAYSESPAVEWNRCGVRGHLKATARRIP